ncbi:MAG: M16 family metallopeptidase [Gemmatimonadaceae bacterium]
MIDPASVVRHVLPNGLTLLVRRDASAPVAAIVTYVKAGYFDETDDVVGIAHVLEHMFFKGTPTRGVGEIARQTKAVGGYLNAHTIYDHTSYYAVVPASGFTPALDVQFDAYARSVIDAGELRRELEVIIQEAKRKEDNPQAVATETLYELLHDRHRMRRWRIGREAGLRALGRDDLLAFYRNFYRPSNTILSIVGDLDPARVIAAVEARYGTLEGGTPVRSPGPSEAAPSGFRARQWEGDIGQAQLVFGWRTPGTMHADTVRLDLASAVLGSGRASRLYRAVRERQLASSVSAYDYTPTELGVFVVHAESSSATMGAAARETWAQVQGLRDEGVREVELERAKRLYESRWLRRLEDMEGQANHLAEWEALGDWQLGDRYMEQLARTTATEVQEAAVRWLDPEQAAVVAYRPRGSSPLDVVIPRERSDRGILRPDTVAGAATGTPTATAGKGLGPRPSGLGLDFEGEENGVRVYRTRGGVPVLVRRKGGALFHAGVYIRGGAVEEGSDRAGLTMLTARTALKGTTSRSAQDIALESEMLGASLGSAAGGESFGWTISVPAKGAREAMALLADVVLHPTFPDAAVATERELAIRDVVSLRDDMYRWPVRLAQAAAYGDHPYGRPVSGTEESLATLDATALRAWHRDHVLRGATTIGVVADMDPDEAAALAASAFDALAYAPAPQVEAPRFPGALAQRVERRDKAQTALALVIPGPARNDTDRFAAEIITGIASGLGGRFFEELRDTQSLCYTVQAFHSERPAAGSFLAYIATSPDKEEVAREGLLREFARFRETPVEAEELERARAYAIGTNAIRQQHGGVVLAEMVDAFMFGTLAELGEYESRMHAVTRAAVQGVAERYFRMDSRAEGIVRGTATATSTAPATVG